MLFRSRGFVRRCAEGADLFEDGLADLLPGDVDERGQMRQGDGLAAILVGWKVMGSEPFINNSG